MIKSIGMIGLTELIYVGHHDHLIGAELGTSIRSPVWEAILDNLPRQRSEVEEARRRERRAIRELARARVDVKLARVRFKRARLHDEEARLRETRARGWPLAFNPTDR